MFCGFNTHAWFFGQFPNGLSTTILAPSNLIQLDSLSNAHRVKDREQRFDEHSQLVCTAIYFRRSSSILAMIFIWIKEEKQLISLIIFPSNKISIMVCSLLNNAYFLHKIYLMFSQIELTTQLRAFEWFITWSTTSSTAPDSRAQRWFSCSTNKQKLVLDLWTQLAEIWPPEVNGLFSSRTQSVDTMKRFDFYPKNWQTLFVFETVCDEFQFCSICGF